MSAWLGGIVAANANLFRGTITRNNVVNRYMSKLTSPGFFPKWKIRSDSLQENGPSHEQNDWRMQDCCDARQIGRGQTYFSMRHVAFGNCRYSRQRQPVSATNRLRLNDKTVLWWLGLKVTTSLNCRCDEDLEQNDSKHEQYGGLSPFRQYSTFALLLVSAPIAGARVTIIST